MNIDQHTTKVFIKNLPPVELNLLLDKYQIPTPLKEILKTVAIYDKEGYPGCDFMESEYKIHISYWQFGRLLKKALILFRKCRKFDMQ